MLAYTYPYHMQQTDQMKPLDCQDPSITSNDLNTLRNKVTQFNSRHPLIQLRFNVHDSNHRPSCFKKGPECRTELPKKHKHIPTSNQISLGFLRIFTRVILI